MLGVNMSLAGITLFVVLCLSAPILGSCAFNSTTNPLLLSTYIESGDVETGRNLSQVNSTLFAGVDSYSGYITVNSTYNSNLFFWYFPATIDNVDGETPLLIWLEGGPGTSSMYGLFAEAGALSVVGDTAELRNITWGGNYSIVFIDNPVGTGFSFTDSDDGYAIDEDDVGAALLSFVQQFTTLFPALSTSPLFLVGSSYAGKFIPALGHYILDYNNGLDSSEQINLTGLIMGNAWTDPPSFVNRAEWALSLGLVDQAGADIITEHENLAMAYYAEGNYTAYSNESDFAFDTFVNLSGVNQLNILKDPADFLTVNLDFLTFLDREDVKEAIHVPNVTFSLFNSTVTAKMAAEEWLTLLPWLEEILEAGIPVMCYSGQLDTFVPYPMSVKSYNNMTWSGASEYQSATRTQLFLDDGSSRVIGYEKAGGNFTDVLVRNAGHVVPPDQPAAARYIVDRFINKYV